MRAHHEIDVACGNVRRRQRAHIGIVGFHIPIRTRRPRLVVTDAAVDQNGVMRRLHHIGLKTQDHHVLRIERDRLPHPRRFSASRSGVRPGSISSAGRKVVSCSMMRWMVRSPMVSLRLMATPADYAGGGTEILTEGRVSIFSWKASSFG